MNPFVARLDAGRTLLLDGGFASELEGRGFPLTTALWSGEAVAARPDLVREIHADYARAGAEILTTASYQLTVRRLLESGRDRREAKELLERSIRLAREAARDAVMPGTPPPLVAASIGSFGAYLTGGAEFHGRYELSRDAFIEHHRPQIEGLAAASPDVFALETFARVDEALIVCDLLGLSTAIPTWVAFCLRDAESIGDGTRLVDAIRRLDGHPTIRAIGFNCSAPDLVVRAVESARTLTALPIIAYPNSGETYSGGRWHATTLGKLSVSESSRALVASGAAVVGGCCRTTPSAIESLRRRIDSSRG